MNLSASQLKRRIYFQPPVVLIVSLFCAAIYASYMLRSPAIRSHMFEPSSPFMYVVPIIVPFVAFLFDRADRFGQRTKLQYAIDVVVVCAALGRMLGNLPLISGHTLFLTYAILSSRSAIVRFTAIVVMAQAVYLKYFVWHDFVTSTAGTLLGSLAAIVVLKLDHNLTLVAASEVDHG